MFGELRCLNCSRHLADVVDGGSGRPRLSHPGGRTTAPILVERTPRGLRCGRCGGRALLEPAIGSDALRPMAATPAARPLTPAA
jgi:DNA-directed RNA polymerase subunit RPC12/RpoP